MATRRHARRSLRHRCKRTAWVCAVALRRCLQRVTTAAAAAPGRVGPGTRRDRRRSDGGGGAGGGPRRTISVQPVGGWMSVPRRRRLSPVRSRPAARRRSSRRRQERGVCCVAQSLCTCTPYTCRSDPSSSFCQCGSVVALAGVTLGTAVAECPAPTAAQKCCFSQDNASCICSRPGVRCGRNPGGELFSDRRRELAVPGRISTHADEISVLSASCCSCRLASRSRRVIATSARRHGVEAPAGPTNTARVAARGRSRHRRSRARWRRDDGERHRRSGRMEREPSVQVPLRTR